MNLRFDQPLSDIEEYKQYFKHCENAKYRMEASPGYIYGGRKLAQGMKDVLGDAKIIIVLREPIKRLYSFFVSHQSKFVIEQDIDFQQYLQRCKNLAPEQYKNPNNYPYFQLTNGCYADYLQDWLDIFGKDLKILFFDDLVQDNRLFMRSICDWLVIDPHFYDAYNFVIENKTRGAKYKQFHKLAMHINNRLEKFLRKNMRIKKLFRNLYYFFNEANSQQAPKIAEKDREYLESYYAPYNEKLRHILEQVGYVDLPQWLQDEPSKGAMSI